MTFKEQVLSMLPPGSMFLRMYSESPNRARVEYQLDEEWHGVSIDKVDLGKLSEIIPFISISLPATKNDLYRAISDQFDLGLVEGTDYHDTTPLLLDATDRYMELPASPYSLGYVGVFKCRVRVAGDSLNSPIAQRDLTYLDVTEILPLHSLKTFLVSSVFTLSAGKMFSDVALSVDGVGELAAKINGRFPKYGISYLEELLKRGQVVGLLNDGLTDLFVFKLSTGEEFFVRFNSPIGDLPNVNFIFNVKSDPLDDNSEGLLSEVESVDLEDPVGSQGESLYIQTLTTVNDPNPSLSPEESIPETNTGEEETTIIGSGETIEILQEDEPVIFE